MRAEPSLLTEPLLGPLSPTNDVETDKHTNPGRRKHDKQEQLRGPVVAAGARRTSVECHSTRQKLDAPSTHRAWRR